MGVLLGFSDNTFYNVARTMLGLHVNTADVFPQYADADQLYPSEEQNRCHQRRISGQIVAEQDLVYYQVTGVQQRQ
ncbi:hypothetical protein D3C72_2298840 [compost metagenome]